MKYKIGDKVTYKCDNWRFYGVITAVIDNSICPCYRLNIERIIKKSCSFSITPFEFELKADDETVPEIKSESKWDNTEMIPIQHEAGLKARRNNKWDVNYELYQKGEKSNIIQTWASHNRKLYKTGQLNETKLKKLTEINFPFEIKKKQKGKSTRDNNHFMDSWDSKFEQWKKGERASLLQWRQKSVKQYVDGRLSNDRIEKLKEVGILK